MTATQSPSFNRAPVRHSVELSRPLGAFVPCAWRVIVRLRTMPAPDGFAGPVVAFVGDLESARRALMWINDTAGAHLSAYIVNDEGARGAEASAPRWVHAERCAVAALDSGPSHGVSPIAVRTKIGYGARPEYWFTLPYKVARRYLDSTGGRSGSTILARPLTAFYSLDLGALIRERAFIIERARAWEGTL